jgi:hypothetical protein
VLTLNAKFRLFVNDRLVSTSTNPEEIEHNLLVERAGEYMVRLEHVYALTALFQSEDIAQNTPFMAQTQYGYTKRYLKQASASFSAVVEEMNPSGTIFITGPKVINAGETANLKATITSLNVHRSDLYISWMLNGRIMGNEESLVIRNASAGEYKAAAELWLKKQPRPVRLARAAHSLIVKEVAKPKPKSTGQKDRTGGRKKTGTPGVKTFAETAEAVLEEYRSLYPAYLQKYYSGRSIEMRANATPSGSEYLCSYIAWDIIKDGPRKGERYKAADFTRLFTLSDLKGLIPGMKKLLGQ